MPCLEPGGYGICVLGQGRISDTMPLVASLQLNTFGSLMRGMAVELRSAQKLCQALFITVVCFMPEPAAVLAGASL